MRNVYVLKQKGDSSYFGYVRNGPHQKPISMVLGFRSKTDAQRSRHILMTHIPVKFKKDVLTLINTPNPITTLMHSGTVELYKDDFEDFSEYLSMFNTRLQLVNEIVIQPNTVKMLVLPPRPTLLKPTPESLATTLQLVYEADDFPSDFTTPKFD